MKLDKRHSKNLDAFEAAVEKGEEKVELNLTNDEHKEIIKIQDGTHFPVARAE